MELTHVWEWLEGLPVVAEIGATWWFPLFESIHVVSSTFIVGSILMVDLRLLGLAAVRYPVTRVVREVIPWTYAAAAVSVGSGVPMFATRASHYASNPAFQIKMALLVFAGVNMAIFHLVSARGIAGWNAGTSTTVPAKLAGACSLTLWIAIMLAGRWIGHLS